MTLYSIKQYMALYHMLIVYNLDTAWASLFGRSVIYIGANWSYI